MTAVLRAAQIKRHITQGEGMPRCTCQDSSWIVEHATFLPVVSCIPLPWTFRPYAPLSSFGYLSIRQYKVHKIQKLQKYSKAVERMTKGNGRFADVRLERLTNTFRLQRHSAPGDN